MSIHPLPDMLSLTVVESNLTARNNENTLKQINETKPNLSVQLPLHHIDARTHSIDARSHSIDAKKDALTLDTLTQRMEAFLSTLNTGIAFRVDEHSGKQVVTFYERSTGDIIKQYPEEKMLKIAQRLADHVGSLIDEKV